MCTEGEKRKNGNGRDVMPRGEGCWKCQFLRPPGEWIRGSGLGIERLKEKEMFPVSWFLLKGVYIAMCVASGLQLESEQKQGPQ